MASGFQVARAQLANLPKPTDAAPSDIGWKPSSTGSSAGRSRFRDYLAVSEGH
jgi:hypothetical protein